MQYFSLCLWCVLLTLCGRSRNEINGDVVGGVVRGSGEKSCGKLMTIRKVKTECTETVRILCYRFLEQWWNQK